MNLSYRRETNRRPFGWYKIEMTEIRPILIQPPPTPPPTPHTTNASTSLEFPLPSRPHPHAGARYSNGSWGYVADVTRVRRWMWQRYHHHHQQQQQDNMDGTMDRTIQPKRQQQRSWWTMTESSSRSASYATAAAVVPPLSYLPIQSGEEMNLVCNVPPGKGQEGKDGWSIVNETVIVNGRPPTTSFLWIHRHQHHHYQKNTTHRTTSYEVNASSPSSSSSSSSSFRFQNLRTTAATTTTITTTKRRTKLLCAIYTHKGKHSLLRAVTETWGWRCDGFFAASTMTVDDPSQDGYGAIDLPHEGPESYDNMWMKTRSIWSYIHDHYLDDYDSFLLCGDDTHVIVENLRILLDVMNVHPDTEPLFLGHWIAHMDNYYIGGGSGYVFNRYVVRILVEQIFPVCRVHTAISAEDRMISVCLRSFGIVGNHSVDVHGAQLFHGMNPQFIATYRGNHGFFKPTYDLWGRHYGYKVGPALVSPQSVTFHLFKTPAMMKRHHAILYKSCPRNTILGDLLANVTKPTEWSNDNHQHNDESIHPSARNTANQDQENTKHVLDFL